MRGADHQTSGPPPPPGLQPPSYFRDPAEGFWAERGSISLQLNPACREQTSFWPSDEPSCRCRISQNQHKVHNVWSRSPPTWRTYHWFKWSNNDINSLPPVSASQQGQGPNTHPVNEGFTKVRLNWVYEKVKVEGKEWKPVWKCWCYWVYLYVFKQKGNQFNSQQRPQIRFKVQQGAILKEMIRACVAAIPGNTFFCHSSNIHGQTSSPESTSSSFNPRK